MIAHFTYSDAVTATAPREETILSVQTRSGPFDFSQWGFEIGDWFSFVGAFGNFSWGSAGIRTEIETVDSQSFHARYSVELAKGTLDILTRDWIEEDLDGEVDIRRRYIATARKDSYVGDFVVRLECCASPGSIGRICKEVHAHKQKNVYHQRRAATAELLFPGRLRLLSSMRFPPTPDFSGWTYVRDEPPRTWVLHHRALSDDAGCQVWSVRRARIMVTRPFATLLKAPAQYFWLYRERYGTSRRIPPFHFQSGYVSVLAAGSSLELDATVRLRPEHPG